MNMLVLSLIPLWIVCIVGYIWLVVRAFKTGIGWGLGVFLLSPLTAIIYALKYWDEAKKPFLVYMMPFVGIFGVLFYLFISSGNPNPLGTNLQTSNPTQQGAPLEAGKIEFMEKSLAFLEKFAQTEKDKQFLAVLRQYIHHMKSGSTDVERMALKQDLSKLLERPDLTEKQRQDLMKILQQLEQQEKTTTAMAPESAPQQNVTAGPAEKTETSAHPQAAKLQEAKPKVQPVSLNSDPKSSLSKNEAPPKQPEIAPPQSQPKDTSNAPIASLQPKPPQSPYKTISARQAKNYIGSPVVLVGPNGIEQQCILAGVSGNVLRFEKHFNSGVFSFSYRTSEIKSLKVYRP